MIKTKYILQKGEGGLCGNLMSYEWGVSPNLMISDEGGRGGSKKYKNHLISYMDDPLLISKVL